VSGNGKIATPTALRTRAQARAQQGLKAVPNGAEHR